MLNLLKDWINSLRLNFQSYQRKKKLHNSVDHDKVAHLLPSVQIQKKWYGSSYGGFYVYPHLLSSDSIVYSFGIGEDISFDLKCINRHHCQVFAFDPTPRSIRWIERKKLPGSFHFYKYGLGATTGPVEFYAPPDKISGSIVQHEAIENAEKIEVELRSLFDIAHNNGHSKIDLLKIDIEGAEYEVIEHMGEWEIFVGQIAIEFHDRMFNEDSRKSEKSIQILRKNGYEVFASSMSFEEVSLIHQSLLPQ